MKVFLLRQGKLVDLEEVDHPVPPSEADGFEWYSYRLLFKNSTLPFIFLFPYLPLFPTIQKLKNLKVINFNSSCISADYITKTPYIFWPKEIQEFSWNRPEDIIIGSKTTTTISYLEEIKGYLLNTFPKMDFLCEIIVTDIHYKRVRRDFVKVFSSLSETRFILVDFHVIKIVPTSFSVWVLKLIKIIREQIIFTISSTSIGWNLYYRQSMRKGGLKV